MSKQELLKRMQVLNKRIDNKIINGGDTRKDEREHANLYFFYKSSMSK